jgi:peptidyl-dipeptidase A
MWGQEWQNLDIVVPFPDVDTYDVTDTMVAKGYTPLSMFQLAEEFFVSIGLEPMTDLFWNKSMIVRPDNRPVQCHASAEDFLNDNDFR